MNYFYEELIYGHGCVLLIFHSHRVWIFFIPRFEFLSIVFSIKFYSPIFPLTELLQKVQFSLSFNNNNLSNHPRSNYDDDEFKFSYFSVPIVERSCVSVPEVKKKILRYGFSTFIRISVSILRISYFYELKLKFVRIETNRIEVGGIYWWGWMVLDWIEFRRR